MREELTDADWRIINESCRGPVKYKLSDLCKNIRNQGWISDKQRKYMNFLYDNMLSDDKESDEEYDFFEGYWGSLR